MTSLTSAVTPAALAAEPTAEVRASHSGWGMYWEMRASAAELKAARSDLDTPC